ncbi:inactive serine/threonine-protein kinase PLK5 isoform X1 [Pelodiscus sinensis]|uniref:inactive serine/threonine-protein kinase PLK5 isoform X1 n=1 Tax=Pelodiscus sinensis TaxID=13735 RepID=UPI003F6D3579
MEHPAGRRAQGASLSYFIQDPGTGTLYRRGQLLGKGAFGRCYKFTDRSTGRVFAAKIVPRDRVSQLGRGKVEKEIELHSHLCHPHVVGFHRHFADQDNIYMILEYCSRKSLAHVLKARNSLTEPEVRYYLRQIIAGLRYLHRQGLIHRDLKLSNFFLTKNMQVKIGDLGLATREGQAGRSVVCGTPNYLAPEVVAKQGHSFQSDIWALGCIMYTALTGCAPFETTPRPEMYRCIREGRYPAPSHLSPSARKLIARLLAPNPSERPSLDEVLEHEFFTEGFTPDKLPCRACRSVPVLALPGRLSQLLQKAAQVLFGGCQEPRAGRPVPAEEPGSPTQPSEVGGGHGEGRGGGSAAPALPSLPGQVQRGGAQAGPLPEAPSRFPIQLLMASALGPSRSGADCWSVARALESVTRVLSRCLENMPPAEHNPRQSPAPPGPWVTRWVDCSHRYGFGYRLSDGSTGALLTDGTHLAFCPRPPRVCYCPGRGEAVSFPPSAVPASLAAKMGTLHFFSQYMQQRLLEEGNEPGGPRSPTAPCLLCCTKSDRALLMLFSNGMLQINFYRERTKLVLGCPGGGRLLTFLDQQRVGATFPLGALAAGGCEPALRERLQYALALARCL